MKLNKKHLLSLFDEPAKTNLPQLGVGDTVRIGILLVEGNKERTQYFEGIIIAYKTRGGQPIALVRKMSQGVGVEKTFLLASPKVVSVERKKLSKVRRAKLYFLRGLTGSKPRKLKDQSWKLKDAS